MPGPECRISFADLFLLAHGRAWRDEEAAAFDALSQDERNRQVEGWAATVPGMRTETRRGDDGLAGICRVDDLDRPEPAQQPHERASQEGKALAGWHRCHRVPHHLYCRGKCEHQRCSAGDEPQPRHTGGRHPGAYGSIRE